MSIELLIESITFVYKCLRFCRARGVQVCLCTVCALRVLCSSPDSSHSQASVRIQRRPTCSLCLWLSDPPILPETMTTSTSSNGSGDGVRVPSSAGSCRRCSLELSGQQRHGRDPARPRTLCPLPQDSSAVPQLAAACSPRVRASCTAPLPQSSETTYSTKRASHQPTAQESTTSPPLSTSASLPCEPTRALASARSKSCDSALLPTSPPAAWTTASTSAALSGERLTAASTQLTPANARLAGSAGVRQRGLAHSDSSRTSVSTASPCAGCPKLEGARSSSPDDGLLGMSQASAALQQHPTAASAHDRCSSNDEVASVLDAVSLALPARLPLLVRCAHSMPAIAQAATMLLAGSSAALLAALPTVILQSSRAQAYAGTTLELVSSCSQALRVAVVQALPSVTAITQCQDVLSAAWSLSVQVGTLHACRSSPSHAVQAAEVLLLASTLFQLLLASSESHIFALLCWCTLASEPLLDCVRATRQQWPRLRFGWHPVATQLGACSVNALAPALRCAACANLA
jgi:hypothetical protein